MGTVAARAVIHASYRRSEFRIAVSLSFARERECGGETSVVSR